MKAKDRIFTRRSRPVQTTVRFWEMFSFTQITGILFGLIAAFMALQNGIYTEFAAWISLVFVFYLYTKDYRKRVYFYSAEATNGAKFNGFWVAINEHDDEESLKNLLADLELVSGCQTHIITFNRMK